MYSFQATSSSGDSCYARDCKNVYLFSRALHVDNDRAECDRNQRYRHYMELLGG